MEDNGSGRNEENIKCYARKLETREWRKWKLKMKDNDKRNLEIR